MLPPDHAPDFIIVGPSLFPCLIYNYASFGATGTPMLPPLPPWPPSPLAPLPPPSPSPSPPPPPPPLSLQAGILYWCSSFEPATTQTSNFYWVNQQAGGIPQPRTTWATAQGCESTVKSPHGLPYAHGLPACTACTLLEQKTLTAGTHYSFKGPRASIALATGTPPHATGMEAHLLYHPMVTLTLFQTDLRSLSTAWRVILTSPLPQRPVRLVNSICNC